MGGDLIIKFKFKKMDISKLSIVELKALKSDIFEKLMAGQKDLQILNARIAELSEKEKVGTEKNKK